MRNSVLRWENTHCRKVTHLRNNWLMVIVSWTVLFGVLPSTVASQTRVEILELNHRRAEEMIPLIQPLLEEGEKITGMRNKLILRASPETQETVRAVLKEVDAPLVNLRITVRQDSSRSLNRRNAEVSEDLKLKNKGRVTLSPETPGRGGLGVSGTLGESRVGTRFREDDSLRTGMRTQQVITLEGRPAVIYITRFIPFVRIENVNEGDKTYRRKTVEFQEVQTGLSILPRLQGDKVVLEVSPVSGEVRDGAIESTGVHTTVGGRLGQWLKLEGLTESASSEEWQTGATTRQNATDLTGVSIKVEREP